MSEEPKDQRIPIMMSASEVKAIDDWGFENRIRTRAEAVRVLVRRGIEHKYVKAHSDAARHFVLELTSSEPDRKRILDALAACFERLEDLLKFLETEQMPAWEMMATEEGWKNLDLLLDKIYPEMGKGDDS